MTETGIPRQDGPARDYFNNFAQVIAAHYAEYFLSLADSAAISLVAGNYSTAYTLATGDATKSPIHTTQKDEARNACEALIRVYYNQIKFNAAIPSIAKQAVGVAQPNPNRTQRNVPATQAVVTVKGAMLGSHTVTYIDSQNDRKAKPFGAQAVELRVAITEAVTDDVNLGKTYGVFSRNPIGVAFDHADNKKIATYWARWINVRGQAGPWSNPVSMTISA